MGPTGEMVRNSVSGGRAVGLAVLVMWLSPQPANNMMAAAVTAATVWRTFRSLGCTWDMRISCWTFGGLRRDTIRIVSLARARSERVVHRPHNQRHFDGLVYGNAMRAC